MNYFFISGLAGLRPRALDLDPYWVGFWSGAIMALLALIVILTIIGFVVALFDPQPKPTRFKCATCKKPCFTLFDKNCASCQSYWGLK